MSLINLNVTQLTKIQGEIISLDNALFKNYLPELEIEIDNVKNNVQGEEIQNILTTLSSQIKTIKKDLTLSLKKLEDFIDNQTDSYSKAENILIDELMQVIHKMSQLAGLTLDYNDPYDVGPTGDIIQNEDGSISKYYGPEQEYNDTPNEFDYEILEVNKVGPHYNYTPNEMNRGLEE